MIDNPIDLDEARARRVRPISPRDLGDLQGRERPEREWLIPSVLLRRSITLLAGDGGVGKSLLCQQLQVAAALGYDWLGLPIKEKVTSLAVYCEDDEDELHRRYADICKFYGCEFSDLEGRVLYLCGVGEDNNELVAFRGKGDYGKATKTSLFLQLMEIIKDYGVQMTILDTISDVFAGNENIRYQVKAFVTMIRSFALINNGGVVMTSHPSKSAMIDGSGFSGSTAWNGAVRNRLYLTAKRTKDEEGDDTPSDDRVLKIMKSNYGPFGQKIKIRWKDGSFICTDFTSSGGSIVDKIDAKSRLMEAAAYLVKNGSFVVAVPNTRGSLTALARQLPSCKMLSFGALQSAQDALINEGRLVVVEIGTKSRRRRCVRPVDCRYPDESIE
ncbi:MAG TPA: AAA family ATPase [Terracidiphilus sp.]|jgi:RecA-family ATPase